MILLRGHRICKWLVMLWLLLVGGLLSPMAAYTRVAQPSVWQKKPTMSADVCPSYQFHSTSSYTLVVGQTSYTAEPYNPAQASGPNRVRKNDPWNDEPDDDDPYNDPVGQVPDPAPVGEPWVLLLLAVLYIFYTKRKKIQEKFAQFKKKQ